MEEHTFSPPDGLDILRASRLVILDTETTGFGVARGARAIEIAGVVLCDLQPAGWFTTLVDHGIDVPADATKVHGITGDMVRRSGVDALDACMILSTFLRKADALVFHNAAFDLPFLRQIFDNQLGMTWTYHPLNVPVIDTLGLARRIGAPKNDLGTVAERLGVPADTAHRALGDAMTTARILGPLASDAWQSTAKAGPISIAELSELSEGVMQRTEARFGRKVDFRRLAGFDDTPTPVNAG